MSAVWAGWCPKLGHASLNIKKNPLFRWAKMEGVTTEAEVRAGYRAASLNMARLNKIGAKERTIKNNKNLLQLSDLTI